MRYSLPIPSLPNGESCRCIVRTTNYSHHPPYLQFCLLPDILTRSSCNSSSNPSTSTAISELPTDDLEAWFDYAYFQEHASNSSVASGYDDIFKRNFGGIHNDLGFSHREPHSLRILQESFQPQSSVLQANDSQSRHRGP